MGADLYQTLPQAKELFDRADEILGYSLSTICFEGPAEALNATANSQPALFVSSMAALEKIKLETPELIENCQASAGLSLGEYTAMTFAGGLSFEDGLRLVRRRGEAMQAAADETPSGMVSVLGLDREQVESVCDQARCDGEILQIANLLCPGNIVVSGHRASCDRVEEAAKEAGAMKTIPLSVAGAFHTAIMESAVGKLGQALAEASISETRIPVVSNVDAAPHTNPSEFETLLVNQVCSTVHWEDSMRYLIDQDFDTFYEVGTGRVLCGLMKRIDRKRSCQAVGG